jgi:hypothetical protein
MIECKTSLQKRSLSSAKVKIEDKRKKYVMIFNKNFISKDYHL